MSLPLTVRRTLLAAAVILGIGASGLVNPEAWWARYAPQLWLVPLVPVWLSQAVGRRLVAASGGVVLLILALNAALVGASYARFQTKMTSALRAQLVSLSHGASTPLVVHFGEFRSNRVRLRYAGIPYVEVNAPGDLPCPNPHQLVMSPAVFCGQFETSPSHRDSGSQD